MQYDLKDSFLDAAYELPKEISRKVWKAVRLVSRNPESPGLNFEKLQGKADGLSSIRVDQKYRVILVRNPQLMTLLFVGPEEEAYSFAERVPKQAQHAVAPQVVPVTKQESPRTGAATSERAVFRDTHKSRTGKYVPLARHLLNAQLTSQNIKLSFHEIEGILQTSSPPSARKHRAWRANDPSHVQAAPWLRMGWRVAKVDLQDEVVIFEPER